MASEGPPPSAPATPAPATPEEASEPEQKEEKGSLKKPAASAKKAPPLTPTKRPKAKAVTPMKVMKKPSKAASPQPKAATPMKVEKKPKTAASSKAKAATPMRVMKKPKTAASSKPKAATPMKVMKKPKAKAKSKGVKQVVLKKPAASQPQANSLEWASKLKVESQEEETKTMPHEGEEEEDHGADDMEVDPNDIDFLVADDLKDRSKNNKFKKMLKDGTLPKWAVDAWNRAGKMTTGRLVAQRTLVNNIISRDDGTGKLKLDLNNPVLNEVKNTFQRNESKDISKALTKTLFCGKFNLSEDAFQAGLAAGEFSEVIGKDGKTRYAWQELEHTVSKGVDTSASVSSETYLSKKDGAFESFRMDNIFIGLFKKNAKLSIGNQGQQLALCDVQRPLSEELWSQAQGQLTAAVKFFDAQLQQAKKLLSVVDEELYQELLHICCFITAFFLFIRTFFPFILHS